MNSLSFKTVSVSKSNLKKRWLLVDATDKSLGRISSTIVKIIRGKHKSYFTPNINCGDHVIITNVEKINFKKNNRENKKYIRYTGYPSGQRFTNIKEQLIKDPKIIIKKAIRGMLPKNRLRDKIFKNLHVYIGSDHKHQAQKPIIFNFFKNY